MANHPNRSLRPYMGATITRTEAVCLDNGRRLYSLSGAVTKRAMARPFLTTVSAARDYVRNILKSEE